MNSAVSSAPCIAFAAGGTGGHVYPALAVMHRLLERIPSAQVLFFGRHEGLERNLVESCPVRYIGLSIRGIPRKLGLHWISAPLLAIGAFFKSVWTLLRQRPVVVIGFGSYVAGPVVLAALCLRIPTIIHEQNAWPGVSNQWLAPWVSTVLVSHAGTPALLKRNDAEVIGIPLRAEVVGQQADPQALGLNPELKTILIFGGSQGARKICRAAADALPQLTEALAGWQVLLITGRGNYEEIAARTLPENVIVRDYVEDMGNAYAIANLVISRAGAVSIAEITANGLPSILIPLAIATGGHQAKNAQSLLDSGAAETIANADLTPERLVDAIRGLVSDPQRLSDMAEASKKLGRPNAAEAFAERIERVL